MLLYAWKIPQPLAQRIVEVAKKHKLDPNYLAATIAFESNFQPRRANPISGAVGLIQWTKRGAELVGTTRDELAKMSALQQMRKVDRWLEIHRPPNSLQGVYLSVFAPAHMRSPRDGVIYPQQVACPNKLNAYCANQALDRDKDGAIRVDEAMRGPEAVLAAAAGRGPYVFRTRGRGSAVPALLVLAVGFLLLRHRRG